MQFGSHSSIRLERGELVSQIKNLRQDDWIAACERLGLYTPIGAGKGSHRAVYKEMNCDVSDSKMLVTVIQKNPYPNIQRDHLKKIVAWGQASGRYDEDAVWRALGVLR